ncbi:MAG TPA: hypothetical protein DCG57_13025 [Candidatus Riflebacteria bacterium]|nr:hypothetical protein [Candidatus Riflebacteria bacterium]
MNNTSFNLSGSESDSLAIRYPSGSELVPGFNPNLSWSHYRALMRVSNEEARNFYEKEARMLDRWTVTCDFLKIDSRFPAITLQSGLFCAQIKAKRSQSILY